MPTAATDVVVRRRNGLMAAGAVVATVVAVGYLWSFSQSGHGLALVIGTVVGLVALGFAVAWRDARTPLLVADETGVRVRLGSAWTGVPWQQVECVEVQQRGRVRDGHVAVLLPEGVDVLAGATTRSRLAAWVNHMFFETPLVTPFGLSTTVSVVDVVGSLRRLAAGRAQVMSLDEADDAPESTVEIVKVSTQAVQPDAGQASDRDLAGPVDESEPPGVTRTRTKWRPFGEKSPWRDGDAAARGQFAPAIASAPVEQPVATHGSGSEVSARPVVASLRTSAARREEVTISPPNLHQTDGGLALTPAVDDAEPAIALPEIEQLRRTHESNEAAARDDAGGNVGLIIDATTDLSARAMQRVRSRQRGAAPESEVRLVGERSEPVGELFGKELQAARLRLGLTVDDLAERTRIRAYVIESIEVDDFVPCGGDFYARGHLRQLARALDLDAAPLITTYDEHVATSPVTPLEVFEVELAAGTTGMVRGGERGANWAALIGAVLVLLIIWGVARYFVDDSEPASVAPTNDSGLASPGPGNPPVADPVEASVRLTAVGGDSAVVVKDRFRDVVFKGVLTDGMTKRVTGESPLRVQAANGAVIELRSRGKSLGPMGDTDTPAAQLVRHHR
jgi:cytoskeleton protein RodZ